MAQHFPTPLGDSALVVAASDDAPGLAVFIEGLGLSGVCDVVAAFDQVAVYFDPLLFDQASLESGVSRFVPGEAPRGKSHTIPVCYELGVDLDAVADGLGVSVGAFVAEHTSRAYDCKAIGFCPGFPYLGWLDESISGLGRLDTPRLRVEAGSVAIAGRMTGVYTLDRPGGWWIVGRTPLTLVDQEDGYFPISVGDSVQFGPVSASEFDRLRGERL